MRRVKFFLAVVSTCAMFSIPSGATAEGRTGEIYAISRCAEAIRFFVRHAPSHKRWINTGWYKFGPFEKAVLTHEGVPINHLTNHELYIYGYRVGTPSLAWSGELETSFNGDRYGLMRLRTDEDDDGTSFILTCGR